MPPSEKTVSSSFRYPQEDAPAAGSWKVDATANSSEYAPGPAPQSGFAVYFNPLRLPQHPEQEGNGRRDREEELFEGRSHKIHHKFQEMWTKETMESRGFEVT